ncbi:4-galactosyl-N-acetylglucosaminide 3-alpha-L-fucosyltransferase 9-like [Clytia hemisphaerica]|uniref:4-galactosyl-N-acetylglucosaminide 3-alpha-L-fucosyltransferase 9-like n=1 Tax=Clytia hemisphaerica TaxID=252671 RepID=UPI0034D52BBC
MMSALNEHDKELIKLGGSGQKKAYKSIDSMTSSLRCIGTCLGCRLYRGEKSCVSDIKRRCLCGLVKSRTKDMSMMCKLILLLIVLLFVGVFYHFWTSVDNSVSSSQKLSTRSRNVRKELYHARQKRRRRKPSLGEPFNAEAWSNATANTRKHYVILYWSKIRDHKARIQKKAEYVKDNHVWPYTYAGEKGECPVSCELINDRSRAHEADAFVVHSRLTDVNDHPPLEHLAPWILQNNENPVYTPALTDPRIMSKFNLLISYRLDSDFPSPIYPPPTTSKPIPFGERLGDVLAVFSKCEIVRTEYMRQLMKYIDVHSYGACLKNRDGLIGLYGHINGKYVFKDYKVVLTRFYKFSLVFMNQDCDHFVDDRLYHALETGSIPVYMGTDKIDQFLPGNLKNSIIRVSDFSSPKKLADYLKYLSGNETAFNEYLKWKEIGIGDMSNTTIGRWWKQKYPLFCQVCMRLSQGNLHPGLDIDTCRPREYKDWNLLPPYGDNDHGDVYAEHYVEVDITNVWSIMGIILLVVLYCSFGHLLR